MSGVPVGPCFLLKRKRKRSSCVGRRGRLRVTLRHGPASPGLRFFLAAGVCGRRRRERTSAVERKSWFAPVRARKAGAPIILETWAFPRVSKVRTWVRTLVRRFAPPGSRPEVRMLAASMRRHRVPYQEGGLRPWSCARRSRCGRRMTHSVFAQCAAALRRDRSR